MKGKKRAGNSIPGMNNKEPEVKSLPQMENLRYE